MSKKASDEERPPECIGTLFIDSGAHSLYNIAHKTKTRLDKYAYYDTPEFWAYVDKYAAFIKANGDAVDHYVNVDVIHNAKRSWKVQQYLEKEHGLNPIPVIHMGTGVEWLEHYLERGYKFIGLGGVALEGTRLSYIRWADQMFDRLCDNRERLPCVKVHGFAMTAYASLVRYPWYSVDSASWVKAGGFGMVMFPRKHKGKFTFFEEGKDTLEPVTPYAISCSIKAPASKKKGSSILNISAHERNVIQEWLDKIGVPYGKWDKDGETIERGITTHHSWRKIANIRFFEELCRCLPEWPWPFRSSKVIRGFFEGGDIPMRKLR